jgi:hypothetical protein
LQPPPVEITVDQKQLENVEYFSCTGRLINVARCTCQIKSRIAMAKAVFKQRRLLTNRFELNLRNELAKCYIWSMALCGAEIGTLRKVVQKHLDSFEMWCWRRMEKISRTDRVRNEGVLHRVKENRNILHTATRRNADWLGHILPRKRLVKHVTEGKIEGRKDRSDKKTRKKT